MRNSPGFLPHLQSQLHSLGPELLGRINHPQGFNLSRLINHVVNPQDHGVFDPNDIDPSTLSSIDGSNAPRGLESLNSGETAVCILACGPEALWVVPGVGISLLAMKLLQAQDAKHVWVLIDPQMHDSIRHHLIELSRGDEVKLVQQFESVRLTPDNQLYTEDNEPSFYPTGEGDLFPALAADGTLKQFIDSGGRHIVVLDVRNALSAPDPLIVGGHIESGCPVTCEVVPSTPGDQGPSLCNYVGIDQLVEPSRFFQPTDVGRFHWIGTNTFVVQADLDFDGIEWSWHRTKKEHKGRLVVQHERFLADLTSHFRTRFVSSRREERYMPVFRSADLDVVSTIFKKI